MGRSKFPGKPTKLVNKKRISVLSGINSDSLVNNIDDDFDTNDLISPSNDQFTLWNNNQNGLITTAATTTALQSTFSNDGDGNSIQKKIVTPLSEQPPPSKPPDNNEINKHDDDDDDDDDDDGDDDDDDDEDDDDDDESVEGEAEEKEEGEEDIVGDKIIKKNNNSGVQTRARSNPIMINNNNIKKDNKQQQQVKKKTVTFKNVLETSDDIVVKKVYNPDNAPLTPIIKKECLIRSSRLLKTECIVRPSRLTEILKNNENNIDKLNSITFRSNPQSSISTNLSSQIISPSSSSSVSTNKICDNDETVVMGDKRFILPKRSIHSCRVIKPNKRFLDNIDDTIKRKNSSSTFSSSTKLHSKRTQLPDESNDNNEKIIVGKNNKNDEEEKDDDDDDDEEEEEEEEGDESETARSEEEESDCSQFENEIRQQDRKIMSPSTSMKVILRQPRLQFPTLSTLGNTNGNDGPFSMNLNNSITNNHLGSSLTACRICGATSSFRFIQNTLKFGVVSCESCRKFISKTIKKLAGTSGINIQHHHQQQQQNSLECFNNDGLCVISPICQKTNHLKLLRTTLKDRCSACWLKKCIKTFQIPSGLRQRLISTLPMNMRDFDVCNNVVRISTSSSSQLSPFSIKKETSDMNSKNNIFTNSTTSNLSSSSPIGGGRLLSWPQDCMEMDYKTSKILSLTNSLSENNSTFGSLPLIKPNITEKPIIMINNSNLEIIKSDFVKKQQDINKQHINGANLNKIHNESDNNNKLDETNKIKTRKKDREQQQQQHQQQQQTQQLPPPPQTTIEQPKRQRIDLKGPRVKHVCRSASIVLGQPIATFQNELPLLETMDTPPRPDSPNNIDIVDISQSIIIGRQPVDSGCTDCVTNTTDLGLSPPATPIQNQEDDLNLLLLEEDTKDDDDLLNIEPESYTISYKAQDHGITIADRENRKIEESQKPVTRKLTRPALLSQQTVANITNRTNINSITRKQEPPPLPVISIDFWENYDPAEVSRTGFGLIVTENVPLRALCFLCGSSGLDPLIFCVCCCEPYHQYCVEDEYNLKQPILDETGTSFLDTTTTIVNQTSSLNNRLNWLCPRCTVCYTCNMSSGSKLKCQKCQKNYHSTCLGTSKRLLGADRPLICANCLKCKSCGTPNVSKFVGNLPMCQACFKLRQLGNFCPLCQKCYEDNDFDLKMMECGDCKRWVHARCEGVPDEQYNMLSALPENIEFICKKCSKNNSLSDAWRDAVLAEFKSGLLSVIKLLSKSRQACVLLKLSPRKKSTNCICLPIISNRCIQFNTESKLNNDCDGDGDKNSIEDDVETNDENGFKCFCGAAQRQQHINNNYSTNVLSLLDVKRKINASEYYSVQDFNYDMQLVINSVACDDLLITYKEILSETFPWFQNETKACTDALVEDMYDSSLYNESPQNIELDQLVPMIDVPEDCEDYFYSTYERDDDRVCMFCRTIGEGMSHQESRLLYCGHNTWVHTNCALWSAEVFEEIDGSLQNVHSAIKRGRAIKCSHCKNKGATVGCNAKKCDEQFHYPCARSSGCAFMLDKTVYCPNHILETNEKKCQVENNFEVLRPVYVELDRRKKKMINPSKIQFLIGSLCVKQLGNFIPLLSDYQDAIVPSDFLCTRLFWSSKEPWKIVEYTVKTSIFNNNLCQSYDTGKNFTVDHSLNNNIVHFGLSQISKYHNSLESGEDFEFSIKQDKAIKHILETSNGINNNNNNNNISAEETTEEEPQNNADLLPDEIKDVIFDDLPHELLDGISMLDILPKLMTYEDLVALDMKNEAYFGGDLLKEGKEDISDDEMDGNEKNNEITIWPGTNSTLIHVEDALLSTRPSSGTSRELKRSKSEVFSRNIAANRSHQRSCSLTWSCKLDASTAAKRRKVSMFQDLKLPDSVLLSIGRSEIGKFWKEELPENISERRRSLQNEEIKSSRGVTWTATKKLIHSDSISVSENESVISKDVLDRLKISQLDGVDDIVSNDSQSPIYEHSNNIQLTGIYNTTMTNDCPVKCDRCHCTYRTYESFQRHLPSCEPMSTSESESEATPRSPENETPPTQQHQNSGLMTSVSVSEVFSANSINQFVTPQTHHTQNAQTLSFLPQLNGQNLLQNVTLANSIPITNLQNSIAPMHNVNATNLQTHLQQHGMSNMLVTTSQNQHLQQQQQQHQAQQTQQMFTQSIPVNNFQPQIFSMQNQFQTNQQQQHQQIQQQPQIITLPNNINIQNFNNQTSHLLQQQPQQQHLHQNQPQIIQISTPNGPQLMTITPQQMKPNGQTIHQQQQQQQQFQTTTTTMNSPIKNQLILPQPDKNSTKKQQTSRFQSPSTTRGKGRPTTNTKPIQIKRNMKSTENKPIQMINNTTNNYPVIRPSGQNHQNGQNMLFQSQNSQPIIVQQMGNNQNNLVQYVTDGHNTMQYILPTATNDFKQPQPQYLTQNPMVTGTYQIQTDAAGNLVLANTPTGGLSVLPGTVQLAQSQQPQVIGTILQPQATQFQCGMMATEQMVLGSTPTLEMITDPTSGCMYLTSQPVYYGLETIVRNTVMSSQQFVSSAMQGVLSQNSSFSATTTQVFQASKIEPFMEMPTGYVVLNNVGDQSVNLNMMTQQNQQQNLMQTNSVPTVQQIQTQQQPTGIQQSQPTWRYIKDEQPVIQAQNIQQLPQQQHQQIRPLSPPKSTIKSSPLVVTKIQPQIVNKVLPHAAAPNNQLSIIPEQKPSIILPKLSTSTTVIDPNSFIQQTSHHNINKTQSLTISQQQQQQQKPIVVTSTPNMIPRTKSANVKPKLIAKPVNTNKLQYSAATTSISTTIVPTTLTTAITTTTTIKPINTKITSQSTHTPTKIQMHPLIVPLNSSQPSDNMNTTMDKGNIQQIKREDLTQLNTKNQIVINQQQSSDLQSTLDKQIHHTQSLSINHSQQPSAIILPHQTSHLYQTQNTSASQTTISLPIAPYAPPSHSNGIPMSVVNPIQQYHHSNNNNNNNNNNNANNNTNNNMTITRPTNRVLPMQTQLSKPSPPSPPTLPETKLLLTTNEEKFEITVNTIKDNLNEMLSPNIIEKSENTSMRMIEDENKSFEDFMKISRKHIQENSILNITIQKENDEQIISMNEIFKNNDSNNIIMDSKEDCDTTDVKDKISQILVNLENDECNNKNNLHLETSIYTTITNEITEPESIQIEQKENIKPEIEIDEQNLKYQQRSPLKQNYFQQQTSQPKKSTGPKMLYEIQSQDGFTYKSTSISEIWDKVFEAVQIARRAHGLVPLPDGPLGEMSGFQMLGLKTNALKYLVEQLPGVEKCNKYIPKYHKRDPVQSNLMSMADYSLDLEQLKENINGAIRCEPYISRSEYDMFSWLASRHRKQPAPVVVVMENDIAIPRRGSGSNLPMAMRYRTLKEISKESVGVYRSHIHGRGLFCTRDIEASEMVIEYAGELIRSTLTDKREKYYDSKGIGCYMFKIDDNLVVDATMRGNAARFINHSCEPNCYSKVVDILGHKHIIIFALRRIVQGEELTYDYKFPFEDVKIPCSCGSKRCRKYLN